MNPTTECSAADSLRLPSTPSSAGAARRFVRDRARQCGFDADALYDIDVAVGEAVTNAIEHGDAAFHGAATGQTVFLTVSLAAPFLVIEVQDEGAGFDPATARHATPETPMEERGRGMEMMRLLMDDVSILPTPQGTMVRLCRRLPAQA